jgi:hyperosmotically inducible periplasmic protein
VNRNIVTVFTVSIFLAGTAALTSAAQQTPPDNTRVNQRDRSPNQPTADQGKNNKSDREIMKDIRKSVLDDKSLSTYAHNVKVISQNGQVTLKGVVRSDEERRTVRAKAEEVAGAGHVKDDLSVRHKSD